MITQMFGCRLGVVNLRNRKVELELEEYGEKIVEVLNSGSCGRIYVVSFLFEF